jgi:hypothetical protein
VLGFVVLALLEDMEIENPIDFISCSRMGGECGQKNARSFDEVWFYGSLGIPQPGWTLFVLP